MREGDRKLMVDRQIAGRGVKDVRVLGAMREVPREAFVPERLKPYAYDDAPLPIEAGQTISQPYIVALMIEAAEVRPGERVLEIGAGSGYAAAVLSRIAGQVYAIERHEELTQLAKARLSRLGYANVELCTGDGTRGWPEAAPFDAILAGASGPSIPRALKDQLAPGGRLVMPVQVGRGEQRLLKLKRVGENRFRQSDLGEVAFVPLVGEHGWADPASGRTYPLGL
jgi:protein-L-isoaspartate(D-aspartate) O-methyltransferase